MRRLLAPLLLILTACPSQAPVNRPNDREWNLLLADYQWIQTLRAAQKAPPAGATRKQEIEIALDNIRKLEPPYQVFTDKVSAYSKRTRDPRAAALLAGEKIYLGDEYMNVLSRYEQAIPSSR